MPAYEFPLDVKRHVAVNLALHLNTDKPDASGGEKLKISRMQLKHRDDRGHESDVLEWHGHKELYETSIDIILRSVEIAACRDAAYQYGGVIVYVLIFHAEEHSNRSRFFFKIPGGQELAHATESGPGKREEGSSFPERIMPDILRYVSQKEEQLDKRSMHLWEMLMKSNAHLSAVVQEYTDNEGKLREIMLNAEDHTYERQKRRKEDERKEKQNAEMWNLIKEGAPKALPVVLSALQRFSAGPNAPYEPGIGDWWAEYQRAQEEKERISASSGNGVAQNGRGARSEERSPEEVVEAEPVAESDVSRGRRGEGAAEISVAVEPPEGPGRSDLGPIRLRVAFDSARFVMLAHGRGKLGAVRDALSPEQRKILDDIVTAVSAEDAESDAAVEKISNLAVAFGKAMREDPARGLAAYAALDKMCQLSLKELSGLLDALERANIGA